LDTDKTICHSVSRIILLPRLAPIPLHHLHQVAHTLVQLSAPTHFHN
jgi:hypothetical protein